VILWGDKCLLNFPISVYCSMLKHGYEFGKSVVNSNGIVGTVLHNVLHILLTALWIQHVSTPFISGFGGLGVSALAFSTQVHGFKPGRSCRIFKGEKILSTPSFGGEVRPLVPCRRFAACKRTLNVAWKSTFRQNYRTVLAHRVPPFATRGLLRCVDVGGHLVTEAGTSKLGGTQGCTISL
jgi:hypothetical protein